MGNEVVSTNNLSNVCIILAWVTVLPHKVQCTRGKYMEEWVAQIWNSSLQTAQLGNLSGCMLMALLLTITLQGDSWANQLRARTPAGPSDRQTRRTASLASPSAVPHVEEAQRTYQQPSSQTYTMFSSP